MEWSAESNLVSPNTTLVPSGGAFFLNVNTAELSISMTIPRSEGRNQNAKGNRAERSLMRFQHGDGKKGHMTI